MAMFVAACKLLKKGPFAGAGRMFSSKSMEKKFNKQIFKCNRGCTEPRPAYDSRPQMIEHWQKDHHTSKNDSDYCHHCGNYKKEKLPCRFFTPCPKKLSNEKVLELKRKRYYDKKKKEEEKWKKKGDDDDDDDEGEEEKWKEEHDDDDDDDDDGGEEE